VKKLSDACMDENKFYQEVICLMRVIKHKNVVRFLGYCCDRQVMMVEHERKLVMAEVHRRLICFEYIPNGSLDKYILGTYDHVACNFPFHYVLSFVYNLFLLCVINRIIYSKDKTSRMYIIPDF
jgi:hypothetical protein